MEDIHRSRSHDPPSLSRVTSDALDPRKHWYVVTKHLCRSGPKELAKNEIFRHFPDEIQSVDPRDLKSATRGCDFNRQPSHLIVVSSFGLCAMLLRQREFSEDGFLRSQKFASVVNTLNGIELDSHSACSFGGKSFPVNNDAQEVKSLSAKILRLEREIEELEKKSRTLDSFLPTSPPVAASTPFNSDRSNSSSNDSSFIEDTLKSPKLLRKRDWRIIAKMSLGNWMAS